ncbi:MAG: hypothetical protein FD135_5394 [Comamonadaceae bacterium]|nr:MAG: hypothetical protein FD135_5394 [Comamonadaceae bacterium]
MFKSSNQYIDTYYSATTREQQVLFWAQGFCGHGLVPTRVAANLVTEAMLGKPERLDAFSGIVPFSGR